MEAPASSPRSRILGHSSMFRFFRSLVGSKGSPKSSDKALLGGQSCPFPEQNATPLMTDHQGGAGRESRPPATLPYTLSVALPQPDPSGLGLGDTGPQTPTPVEVLAQGVEVKPVLPTGSQEVLGNLSELEEREENREQTEAAGDTGTSDRGHFAQALAVEQGCLQRAMGPLDISPETFTREEEKERLLDGDLRLASSQVGATPWNRLLSLYKQLQKSATAKIPLKEGLPCEEKGREQETEEDSSLKLCGPGIVTLQSPLHKTFRSTDTVGFVESELKKLLVVQRESRLWKMGGHEGRKLLTQPEITLEEAGIVDVQHLLLEEMNEMENWPPE
ncbi:LOW QUALITY PROTEIN: gametogenetin-binding protein 1-like [Neophocaena asiaeorientalis asiaeorientalis]|uniref:Gametogenetin-binding protein 1 n=1 Tax=Neophocaena asiaeorientalis asiaeorientalis TaxID=1706337 RepID=A0A341D5B1_NEOAA|nr:LOW QUALITY PROTEIN: gametogenetin-binding protein 1-like [Neophocaena asiaeorientalis asiaeorientalis]